MRGKRIRGTRRGEMPSANPAPPSGATYVIALNGFQVITRSGAKVKVHV